jgi:hypothetical protein
MKKIKLYFALSVVILFIANTSCKKKIYGCTDASAYNTSDIANTDDGSCIYNITDTTKSIESVQFDITFTPATSSYGHDFISNPLLPFSYGDIMILEIENPVSTEGLHWTNLPHSTANYQITFNYDIYNGNFIVLSKDVTTNQLYSWQHNSTFHCRLSVIKQ